MMNRTFRPAVSAARSLRALSTSSRTATSRSSLYFGTAAATLGLVALGYNNAVSENKRILNDASGSANWKPEVGQYNEDLKVNRHKIAAQSGATPESPLHNSKHSDNTHHVGTSKITKEGENIRRGDGTQEKSVPGLVPELADKADKESSEGKFEGAYNEETGEINWDCPCLGGMAQGPCGEDFKAAFSCFIHSEEEPKGLDCVEKFKAMQDCFRKHPEIYGEEIDDEAPEPIGQPTSTDGPGPLSAGTVSGSPLPADHPDQDKVPRKPKTSPPEHSEPAKQTHLNNPAKGIEKIQPKGDRADKKGKGSGDGTI